MKVIDLLNKIAKGEEVPKMFKYNNKIWRLASNRTYFIGSDYGYDFWVEHGNDKFEDEIIRLNDEIEIIEDTPKEDKKIEKLDRGETIHKNAGDWGAIYRTKEWTDNELEILDKMDEIIDELEKLKSKPTIVNINNTPTMHEPYKITYSTNTNGSDK